MKTPQPLRQVKVVRSNSEKRKIEFIAISEEVAERAAKPYGLLLGHGRLSEYQYTLHVSRLYSYGEVWRYLRNWG
jgi:hypothetical protein